MPQDSTVKIKLEPEKQVQPEESIKPSETKPDSPKPATSEQVLGESQTPEFNLEPSQERARPEQPLSRPLEQQVEPAPERPAVETKPGMETAVVETLPAKLQASAPVIKPVPAISPMRQQVENILAHDLESYYQKLTPEEQKIFRAKGEETAGKIVQLLEQAKLKIKKIWRLIKDWLKLLPGVNKFFLEQEAKIKTDQIVQYYHIQKTKKS